MVSLIIGVVVTTVIASVLPARRAARVAPIEALRDSQDAGADHLGRRSVIGVIVTAIGLAFLGYGLFGEPDNAGLLIGGGAAVIFIGIAILSPLAARPLVGRDRAPGPRLEHGRPGWAARTRCATRAGRRRRRRR